MTISEYIETNEELKNLHFRTVYAVINTLIGEGKLSVSDFSQEVRKDVQ